jgi:hypothetical protein
MHGAFDTGIREAANVMAMLAKQRGDTSRNGREVGAEACAFTLELSTKWKQRVLVMRAERQRV